MKSPAVSRRSGFTLIELLVVIVVISILSGIALLAFNSAQKSARDAQRQQIARNLVAAIQCYELDTGTLPTGIGPNPGQIPWQGLASAQPAGFGRCYPHNFITDPANGGTTIGTTGLVPGTEAHSGAPEDNVSYSFVLEDDTYAIELHGETKAFTLYGRQ